MSSRPRRVASDALSLNKLPVQSSNVHEHWLQMKMIKPTSLFKWQQNGSSNKTADSKLAKQPQKVWIHPPTALQNGHIAYLVKYFGNVEVTQPKGIEVVKDSINRLKLMQPLKKAEGNKTPKVELTISVNGVAIQDAKSKNMYTQFPLHRISYCADDKTAKKFFSFIAKDVDADKNLCFVFMSEKMSEEIILTIGQAFDLAYAKFIESSGRELETRKQLIILQKSVCDLEEENDQLRKRLGKYEPEVLLTKSVSKDTANVSISSNKAVATTNAIEICNQNGHTSSVVTSLQPNKSVPVTIPPPLLPPPNTKTRHPTNELLSLLDTDLEEHPPPPSGLAPIITAESLLRQSPSTDLMTDDLLDEDFDPHAGDNDGQTRKEQSTGDVVNGTSKDLKDNSGSEPFQDPFGMGHFTSAQLNSAIVSIDKTLAEMRHGFSQGLSADGFNMDP